MSTAISQPPSLPPPSNTHSHQLNPLPETTSITTEASTTPTTTTNTVTTLPLTTDYITTTSLEKAHPITSSSSTTPLPPQNPFDTSPASSAKYRSLHWWQCSMLMIAETISLGILSLPSVLATIGLIPGLLLIFLLGLLATYTGYVLGAFKLRYPWVHSMGEAGEILLSPLGGQNEYRRAIWGKVGKEFFGGAQMLFLVFVMGSHVLTFSIMMNTITEHGACTIVFTAVGTGLSVLCTLPRALDRISWLSVVSFASILGAVMVTLVGTGLHPYHAVVKATASALPVPEKETSIPLPFRRGDVMSKEGIKLTASPPLFPAFLAVTNIIFAYAGHVTFFSFISELRTPKHYTRSLIALQITDTTLYLLVSALIYTFSGPLTTSPALGSAGPLLSKIAYGVAAPTIIIAGVINGHVAAKTLYVRVFQHYNRVDLLSSNSFLSLSVWVGIVVGLWTVAWVISEGIPNFSDLLGLISALFASWFTFGLSGWFWIVMNPGAWRRGAGWRKHCLLVVNVGVLCMGATICGLGLWSSGKAIRRDSTGAKGAFSCASNAGGLGGH